MKTPNLVTIWIMFAVLVASCGLNSEPLNSEDPGQDERGKISVSAPSQVNTFKGGDFVRIVVQNNTASEISLAEDGISIFMRSGNEWIQIKNLVRIRDRILSSKDNKDYSLTLISVVPEVDSDNLVVVRIIIAGINLATGEEVQAYLDVSLSP